LQEQVFGIKLDFKDPRAVEPVLQILRRAIDKELQEETLQQRHHLQVWLNADVLQGPGGSPSLFVAQKFIATCMKEFPYAVLSLGWTTGATGTGYTREMVEEMISECKGVPGDQLTFAVMAGWVQPSWSNLQRLLTELQSSLTLWGYSDETLLPWLASSYPDYYHHHIFVDCSVLNGEQLLALQEKYKSRV